MAGIRVKVEPATINWVIENIPPDEMPSDILSTLEGWREGLVQPTLNQVKTLSRKIHIPFGYFFLSSPPKEELPILEYRTIGSAAVKPPSRNLVDIIKSAEHMQDWMRDYLIDAGSDVLHFVGAGKNICSALELAELIRKDLGLATEWYTDSKDAVDSFKIIRKRLENVGVLVFINGVVGANTQRKLDIDVFRAFTLIDEYAPLIFINRNDSDGARLFSLLHEVVHIWLGIASFYNEKDGTVTNTSDIERLCNAVTAEILVPNRIFKEKWELYSQHFPEKSVVKKLADMFKCGIIVIARRAKDNNYINKSQYQEIVDMAIDIYNKQKEKRKSGGGNFYRTAASRYDSRFLLALDNSIKERKTQYPDAYRLIGFNRTSFSHLLETVRGGV
ncbi:MAG: ImmA/IrrE family metallo-endopeptidase [Methanomicrobiales archaeon]|jgi:Zn-dependent peptidase ImmA (M78 family)|nr:ImmA/IrrE family metallo-endopeptidase [Methanomicrobiales archaeon]